MIIGTTNTEIDLNNNKLISFKVYRVSKLPDQPKQMIQADDIRLVQCSDQQKLRVIPPSQLDFYKNSLCLEIVDQKAKI